MDNNYIMILLIIIYFTIEELHFKLATGKSSYWWMLNQKIVKKSKVLDEFDYKKVKNKE